MSLAPPLNIPFTTIKSKNIVVFIFKVLKMS